MGNNLSSSKCKADDSKLVPAAASPASPSVDQMDSARDQHDACDYIEVTLHARKVRTAEDDVIELKQTFVSCG